MAKTIISSGMGSLDPLAQGLLGTRQSLSPGTRMSFQRGCTQTVGQLTQTIA